MKNEQRRDQFIAAALTGMLTSGNYEYTSNQEMAKEAVKLATKVIEVLSDEKEGIL